MSIKIFYDKINFRLGRSGEVKRFLEKVIMVEKKIPGDLNFIFTDDKSLLEINLNFLGHDYFTDVISFDYCEDNIVNGEVYMSIDTIKRNADSLNVPLGEEVIRIMIHGVLHLCGYFDDTEENRLKMYNLQEGWVETFYDSR